MATRSSPPLTRAGDYLFGPSFAARLRAKSLRAGRDFTADPHAPSQLRQLDGLMKDTTEPALVLAVKGAVLAHSKWYLYVPNVRDGGHVVTENEWRVYDAKLLARAREIAAADPMDEYTISGSGILFLESRDPYLDGARHRSARTLLALAPKTTEVPRELLTKAVAHTQQLIDEAIRLYQTSKNPFLDLDKSLLPAVT